MDPRMTKPASDIFEVPGMEYYDLSEYEDRDPEAAIRDLFDSLPDTTAPSIEEELEDQETLAVAARQEALVNKPSHYAKWAIEPITFIMRNGFEFWRGNIVKYASRAGSKLYDGMDQTESEITDLRKVIRYAEMRINQLNGEMEL